MRPGHDGGAAGPLPALLLVPAAHWTTTALRPAVLVVFDDDLAASHFLRVARDEMESARVDVPLWVSHPTALERLGPLGRVWLTPEGWEALYAIPRG